MDPWISESKLLSAQGGSVCQVPPKWPTDHTEVCLYCSVLYYLDILGNQIYTLMKVGGGNLLNSLLRQPLLLFVCVFFPIKGSWQQRLQHNLPFLHLPPHPKKANLCLSLSSLFFRDFFFCKDDDGGGFPRKKGRRRRRKNTWISEGRKEEEERHLLQKKVEMVLTGVTSPGRKMILFQPPPFELKSGLG